MLEAVMKFDKYLKKESFTFEAIIIGGSALNIMQVTDRVTRDIDCLFPDIKGRIKELSEDFASRNQDLQLSPTEWLNNGPISIIQDLGDNWKDNLELIYQGENISLYTLSRINLLKTKLFAYCDRDIDYNDCLALKPTKKELEECYTWVALRDANPNWEEHVKNMFSILSKELFNE